MDDVSVIKINVCKTTTVTQVIRSRKGLIDIMQVGDTIIIETPLEKYMLVPNLRTKMDDITDVRDRIKWAKETTEDLLLTIDNLSDYDSTLIYTIIADIKSVK